MAEPPLYFQSLHLLLTSPQQVQVLEAQGQALAGFASAGEEGRGNTRALATMMFMLGQDCATLAVSVLGQRVRAFLHC